MSIIDTPFRAPGVLAAESYGPSQILASSVTSMSNAWSGRPPICRSALDSRYGR